MRIRSIKPEFWKSPKLATVPWGTRLVFAGLISLSDDEGRFLASPRYIASELFPHDRAPLGAVRKALPELAGVGLALFYEVAGVEYGFLPGFLEHQRIQKPSASRLPPPPAVAAGGAQGGPDPFKTLSTPRTYTRSDREHGLDAQPLDDRSTGAEQQVASQGGVVTDETSNSSGSPPVALRDRYPQEGKGREGNGRERRGREASSPGDGFWLRIQAYRRGLRHVTEVEPDARAISSWFSTAMLEVNGDEERLFRGFRNFEADAYWRGRGAMFADFQRNHWRKYASEHYGKSNTSDDAEVGTGPIVARERVL
jgi:hypothetical protein